jgi:hypothetical protein
MLRAARRRHPAEVRATRKSKEGIDPNMGEWGMAAIDRKVFGFGLNLRAPVAVHRSMLEFRSRGTKMSRHRNSVIFGLGCTLLGVSHRHSRGRSTLNSRSAQQRSQVMPSFLASVDQAAARYDFRCPPSSVWQMASLTSLAFAFYLTICLKRYAPPGLGSPIAPGKLVLPVLVPHGQAIE